MLLLAKLPATEGEPELLADVGKEFRGPGIEGGGLEVSLWVVAAMVLPSGEWDPHPTNPYALTITTAHT